LWIQVVAIAAGAVRRAELTSANNKNFTEEIMKSASLWMSSIGLSSVALAAAGGWFAATLFAQPATSKEPRFPQLTMDQLDAKQKPLGEQVMKVSSVGLAGPYNPMMRSPVLGQKLFDLFAYLRWDTTVPTKLNEFAIIIIGRQWRSQVEWFAHAPLAQKAGLSPGIIADLKANKRPADMAEDEAVVYDFVTELTTTKKVSDETYARAKKIFNDQQIVDLTAVSGNYVMVAMLLAVAEESTPPGKEAPFKPGEP
jgi:4-carboxymuconolactone decarboxylase